MYAWAPLGCGNYAPNFFGTSVPEVVEVRENPDGTVTLTVNAVCDMVICDDALITHDLTVKFKEDGSFQYLGNEIRKEDRNNVPEYQYRVKGEIKNGTYKTDYTTFNICGHDIYVYDDELAKVIKQLSDRYRENVLMYYFLDMSDTEIAKLQNISRSGVFQNRHYALKQMKKSLEEEN